jgi:two-component system, LytTR family, response regulator
VLVVDDEPLARTNLTSLLKKDSDIESVQECSAGSEAVIQIRANRPHLVFLDVQMPECDGFDVLEMLGTDLPPAIVFVTAYDQYALRAFEAGALDYLLKPFDTARFELALSRAKTKLAPSVSQNKKTDRLAVKNAGEVLFIKFDEIDWIEAADYYACLRVAGKSHLVRRSLSDLDAELDPSVFCRIHRSTIVNLDRVRGLKLNPDGDYDVALDRGVKLRLSRRYRKQLQWRLGLRRPSDTA